MIAAAVLGLNHPRNRTSATSDLPISEVSMSSPYSEDVAAPARTRRLGVLAEAELPVASPLVADDAAFAALASRRRLSSARCAFVSRYAVAPGVGTTRCSTGVL